MPVKRRAPKERLSLPPEAYTAFEAGDEAALRAAIGQKPWEDSPLQAGAKPTYCYRDEYKLALWRKAHFLPCDPFVQSEPHHIGSIRFWFRLRRYPPVHGRNDIAGHRGMQVARARKSAFLPPTAGGKRGSWRRIDQTIPAAADPANQRR